MASGAKYVVQYRRKRKSKTDYHKRLDLLKSGLPRLVVRPSNKGVLLQLVEYSPDGDKVLFSAVSKELVKMGWSHSTSNIPAAYLTGLLLASKARESVSSEVIVDDGFFVSKKGSRIYSSVKGVLDGGLKIKVGEEMLPDDSLVNGEAIASYVEKSKNIRQDVEKLRKVISSKEMKNG
ncbi:MAG: 50S ribosomal protein L18 [Candidatus Altiarchaeota archaeon]